MSGPRFLIHGLVVESELPLGARAASEAVAADLRICRARGPASPVPGAAKLMAERSAPKRFSAFRHARGYTLVFSDVCEFWLDPVERVARLYAAAETDPEIVALLVTGALLPFFLSLSGSLVLHASAIELDGAVVAIAGASGIGKSTLAGLACAAGPFLMADDALRVEKSGRSWFGYLGVPALRLREPAWPIGALLAGDARYSVDGRLTAASASGSSTPRAPLRCVLLPRYLASRGPIELEPVARPRAAVALLGALRIGSWCDAAILEQQTRAIATLVRDVPIATLRVPRFESYDRTAAEELVSALRSKS